MRHALLRGLGLALALGLAAAPARAETAAEALAAARCTQPVPALDGWLRKNTPSEAQVRASFESNGQRIRKDSAIHAYFAWLAAGRDHEAAAASYHKGVKGYARDFACWK